MTRRPPAPQPARNRTGLGCVRPTATPHRVHPGNGEYPAHLPRRRGDHAGQHTELVEATAGETRGGMLRSAEQMRGRLGEDGVHNLIEGQAGVDGNRALRTHPGLVVRQPIAELITGITDATEVVVSTGIVQSSEHGRLVDHQEKHAMEAAPSIGLVARVTAHEQRSRRHREKLNEMAEGRPPRTRRGQGY